jgi:hypothetical protein
MNLHHHLLAATLSALTQSLEKHTSDSLYSKFCAWCLNEQNPQRKIFVQVLGIHQLVNLTCKLFEGLLSESEWETLMPYAATMNAYLTCEAVSDNMAIGLARPTAKDCKAEQRRQVVTAFNEATVERLKGQHPSAHQLLSPVEKITRQISMFKSSLSPDKLFQLATASVKDQKSWSLQDLNASLQAVLVANAESCTEVSEAIAGLAGDELVRQGLIDRYESVNRLLNRENMSREERVHVGTHAILVAPTIGYYVTVLAQKVRPLPEFEELAADGTLETVLYDAALLVRLLNDMGTPILKMSGTERKQLMGNLKECWRSHFTPAHSIFEVLAKFSETCVDMTRIRKDTLFGEYNLALDLLPTAGNMEDMEASLQVLDDNLAYYSELYHRHSQRLAQTAQCMSDRLQDDLISKAILNFVHFHEILYSNTFSSKAGEYAI